MSDSPAAVRPRLYLDVDGVIIAEASPFETVRLRQLGEAYAPEVISRLGNTCLELVWLTTWGEEALELAQSINGLREGRVLRLDQHERSSQITRKMRALFADQGTTPGPFVWIDDLITPQARNIVNRRLSVPSLMVQTDGQTGLNEDQLVSIEQFAKTHTR